MKVGETWTSRGLTVFSNALLLFLVLTSPEYGVATIWLVATLGSRSVTKRLNRKTILDVDVPKACGAIMDPGAPMALRLQGNLLYGVSRVYSHQCGYTLTDVQAMHDKMKTMLKVLPGGGLDPSAGKARPEQLVLPYDPSFLPDSLPGILLDCTSFDAFPVPDRSAPSYLNWPKTPDLSQSVVSQDTILQLSLSSDDTYAGGLGEIASTIDVAAYGPGSMASERIRPLPLDDEAGVILQADFEFDEDGNIVELGGTPQVDSRPRRIGERPAQSAQITRHLPARPTPFPGRGGGEEVHPEEAIEVSVAQKQRALKLIRPDDQIALKNSELGHLNQNYVSLMAIALKQKQKNKVPTSSKKNAAFWVYGQGIGSVGVGIGKSRVMHPLHMFSGDELYVSLTAPAAILSPKRAHDALEDEVQEHIGRRVRARNDGGPTDQMDISHDDGLWNEDVEIGRHAAPALHDDSFLQMPWNITASIHSSRQGSIVRGILPGIGSVSDFSSHGFSDTGLMRPRNRLTSSSPLAGHGFPFDLDAPDNLHIPGHELDDVNIFDDFDISQYLHPEMDQEHGETHGDNIAAETGFPSASLRTHEDESQRSTLDQESLNFLDYLAARLEALSSYTNEESGQEHGGTNKTMQFSSLLPPAKTSRIVATQGLMHILALATKGLLTVCQDEAQYTGGEEYGALYLYGEIYLSLPGI
ncbi:Rad21/Rec8 N terminal domain protein [Aspergillus saccharolyticus JOP 1030-1]|uniref:Rad21/Rec8-like protein N-terminal domain-containing protein n=1 Tax=Aspergillus saccharolyticus JOP 1030-1 TaxID=1450539 RepID=A0A318ZLG5_9EURO|nr:hypothetical protein BP01DRAFT_340691 [Aspergillus saccharolyticus JOP 1030-1]PYH45313.1 hypothetical protein BP01DRAFT_340691 [Aspergillus saccharolyticus JOP 1030-1]